MNADDESHNKKKVEKPSSDNLTVTVDKSDNKRTEKGEEEPKPRIVLTFRSEKSNAKSSNMKIVSSEEKHEEAPRRSSRTRGKWEWICDSETSPKKDKSGAQTTSENDESDSSHTTPKRSTRRRSKDSDNVLANAIARKEKSYETQAAPQRLSRRIKPTAKVLANEELRMGLVSQNNARLGIQADKSPEEGIKTRRSARPATTGEKKPPPVVEEEVVEIATTDDDSQSQNSVMKLKHLCELGLKAKTPEEGEEGDSENRAEDNEVEELEENEDDEIDDDPNVISKLLETDEEESDEDFHCSIDVKKNKPRQRRVTRHTSSHGRNDSDVSSTTTKNEQKSTRRSSKRLSKSRRRYFHIDYAQCSDSEFTEWVPNPKRKRSSGPEEVVSDPEMEEPLEVFTKLAADAEMPESEPAGGEEGSEAACPVDESTIVATCFCQTPSNVYAAPDELSLPVFCQAVELVDGVRVGCSHGARRASRRPGAALAAMLRAGPRAPYFLSCSLHAAQLAQHMCCPACGLFCTQGTFYQCSSGHLFHLECGLPYNDVKAGQPGCPHCGVYSYRWQPVNTECAKVKVEMKCSNKRIFLPDQREQCTPAYLSFSATPLQDSKIDKGPIIPKDLLPSPPIELKALGQPASKSPTQLYEAIVRGETVDELLPKLVSSSYINRPLEAVSRGTLAHAAAGAGHAAALYLLHYAGANLDAADQHMRTPLMVAIQSLLDKTDKKNKEKAKEPVKKDDETEMDTDTDNITSTEKKEIKIEKEDGASEKEDDSDEKQDDNVKKEDDKVKKEDDNVEKEDDDVEKENDNVEKEVETDDIGEEEEAKTGKIEVKIEREDNMSEKADDVANKPSEEDLIRVIRYLLAAGCDVNFPGPEGMTALHMCAQLGGAEVAKLLLSYTNTQVDPRDQGGWTPLVWAAENDHAEVVKVLLEGGADAMTTDNEGNGVVHWCALGDAPHALRLLLHARPRAADTLNTHCDTPLHIAARQGHYACVVILLARGARTDIENSAGELPVEVCTAQCQSAIWLNMQMNIAVRDKVSKFRLLSSDISNGREAFPIPCVNEVDDATLPEDFTYVTRHLMPETIQIDNTIDTMQGCECKDGDCSSGECSCCALGVRCWYTRGRLQANFPYHDPPMLFECNETCGCNLASQGGSVMVRTSVFRAGGARGWGLRARQSVPRGSVVALYCGELLPLASADTRPADHYMFALDVKHDLREQCADKTQLCVDAMQFGSAARFINHSCRSNLAPVRVFTQSRDLRLPTVALFAITDINPDDELTFDYGDKFWSVKSKWMKCECGYPECRYPEKTEDTESS